MNITAIIYDAAVRKTAYILGTVIGNCKLFPAERAPRDWSGYANVITVAAGEDGPVVTAGLQKRVTFRPKGEDETVAAAELIAKAFCPPEAPMPTDALKARIDAFLEAHNTLALATGCGKWVRCTPLEYLRVNGALYILTEGGLKFKGIWWNGAISAAISFLRTLVFQTASVLILPLLLGVDGIWWAITVAEVFAFLISVLFLLAKRGKYHYM